MSIDPMYHSAPSLLSLIQDLRNRPGMASARRLIQALRQPGVWHEPFTWGDVVMGGSLGVLDLAADLGLPALLERGLKAGLVPTRRTHILAWRARCPRCVLLLTQYNGLPDTIPWADADLAHQVGRARSADLQRRLRASVVQSNSPDVATERF